MIDLHVHSTISDGTYTPSGIAELAKERGLKAYVITDHDNISGCEESLAAAQRLGLETMYAMEMSVAYRGRDLHIVSIGFDPESEAFQKLYRKIRVLKESGTEETVAYIQRMGMNLSYENVKSHASGGHFFSGFHINSTFTDFYGHLQYADVHFHILQLRLA